MADGVSFDSGHVDSSGKGLGGIAAASASNEQQGAGPNNPATLHGGPAEGDLAKYENALAAGVAEWQLEQQFLLAHGQDVYGHSLRSLSAAGMTRYTQLNLNMGGTAVRASGTEVRH